MRISVEGLSKSYRREPALDDVSLDVRPGQIVAVLGANGAGKTTLLRCMAAMAAPDRGKILYDGQLLTRRRVDLRRRLHFLPDYPPLFGGYNILRQLGLVLEAYGKSTEEFVDKVAELLEEFDLIDREHLQVGGLSRGQNYKLALVALLAIDPDLWLLDEPFASGMDPHGISSFRHHARAAARRGRTVVYTTQLIDLAESFSDAVCILDEGRVHAFDTVAALKSRAGGADGVLEAIFDRLRDPESNFRRNDRL